MRAWPVILALLFGCTTPAPRPAPSPTPAEPSPGSAKQAGCPPPAPGQAMTQEQCTCLGGRLNASRGGEQDHCARGETELGSVRFGIEGGWCCKAP